MSKISLFEVLNGKSRLLPESGGVFYYRHPTLFEMEMTTELEEKFTLHGQKRGVLNEKDLLASAATNGGWSEQEELEMIQLKKDGERQKRALKKVENEPSLYAGLMGSIEETKLAYENLKIKRESLTRFSLEEYVARKVNDVTFRRHLFIDENCTEEIEGYDIDKVMPPFMEKYRLLVDQNQTLTLCYTPAFFEMYMVGSNDPLQILGRDFYSMTVFQKNLLVYSNILRNKIDNIPDLPQHVLNDPIQLFNYNPEDKNVETDFNIRKHVESRGGAENLKPEDMAT